MSGECNDVGQSLTLRDYFAAAAMQGMMSDPVTGFLQLKSIAKKAYEAADAMLAARERKEEGR